MRWIVTQALERKKPKTPEHIDSQYPTLLRICALMKRAQRLEPKGYWAKRKVKKDPLWKMYYIQSELLRTIVNEYVWSHDRTWEKILWSAGYGEDREYTRGAEQRRELRHNSRQVYFTGWRSSPVTFLQMKEVVLQLALRERQRAG